MAEGDKTTGFVKETLRYVRQVVKTPQFKAVAAAAIFNPEIGRFTGGKVGVLFSKNEWLSGLALRSRKTRLDLATDTESRAKKVARILVESIPGQFGPWGIGDGINIYEAWRGEKVGGKKLASWERWLHLGAGLVPGVSATLVSETVKNFWYAVEDEIARCNKDRLVPAF